MTLETIDIFGIEEEKLLDLLAALPNLWNNRKGVFESSLELLFSKFSDKDNLLFAVHTFSLGSSREIAILLTEYLRNLGAASFIIYAYEMRGVSGATESRYSTRRLRDILEDCIDVDFEALSNLRGGDIFVCPKCSAQYRLRTLRFTRDGFVECQNCGQLVEYRGLDKNEDTS
ncbi:MAG: hypothetical protein ACFFCT_05525 [Candidatus Odinarchaeota archaeon]